MDIVSKHRPDHVRVGRLRHWLGVLAGSLGLAAGVQLALPSQPAQAQSGYRPADAAPTSWVEFGATVHAKLSERLGRQDDATLALQRLLSEPGRNLPDDLVVRVWIADTGHIERVEFGGLDQDIAAALRAVLTNGRIETAVPAGMLQPIHLRLSLSKRS